MGKKRTLNELRQTKDAHYIPKYDPQTGDKNPYYKELTGEELEEMMNETDAPPGVQFVNEVEIFNATFGKPTTMSQQSQKRKKRISSTTFVSKKSQNIKKLAETETSWKFWMLFAILLMLPWGMPLCYMALKIRFGQRIKKSRRQTCLSLAKLKKKQHKLSLKELRSKVRNVILKK